MERSRHGVTLQKMAHWDRKVSSWRMPESHQLIKYSSKRKSFPFQHLVNIIIWRHGNQLRKKYRVLNYFKRRRLTLLTKRPISLALFLLKENMRLSTRRRLRKEPIGGPLSMIKPWVHDWSHNLRITVLLHHHIKQLSPGKGRNIPRNKNSKPYLRARIFPS